MTGLGGQHALIFQAIAGWDKAALDGSSALVLVRHGEAEEVQIPPESLRLLKYKVGTADEDAPLVDHLERARASLRSGGRWSSSCGYTSASLRPSTPALPVAHSALYLADDYLPDGRALEKPYYNSAHLRIAE